MRQKMIDTEQEWSLRIISSLKGVAYNKNKNNTNITGKF